MGMFDRDITLGGLRLDQEFTIGEKDARGPNGGEVFCLLDIYVMDEKINLPNDLPPAEKTVLRVARWDPDKGILRGEVFDVGTLSSAIAGKAREKSEGDLPALVRAHMAPASQAAFNDATVLTFVSRYDGPVPTFNTFETDRFTPTPAAATPAGKGKSNG